MSKYNPLHSKKVVVLGGSSGIGYSAAEISLDRQAIVFIGSSSQAKVDSAVAEMKAAYPSGVITGRAVDLKDEKSIKAFFDWVDGTGSKGIDHIIFTAGDALQLAPLDDNLDIEKNKDAFEVRVFGILRVAKIARKLFNVGGSFTLTTGSVAYKPQPGWSVASAMGGATESLTRGLAVDLAPIRVNAIAPGVVVTPLWAGMPEAMKQAFLKRSAETLLTKSVGQPEDIAHGYVYLMSSAFVTGTVISIDGGYLIV